MFRELGATVIDADQATHAVYAPESLGFDLVEREFGPDYVRNGRIDRARLGELVLVYVPEPVQVQRLVEGRGLSEDRARAVIASQMPIDDKRARAKQIIDNSGSREVTREHVERLWAEL